MTHDGRVGGCQSATVIESEIVAVLTKGSPVQFPREAEEKAVSSISQLKVPEVGNGRSSESVPAPGLGGGGVHAPNGKRGHGYTAASMITQPVPSQKDVTIGMSASGSDQWIVTVTVWPATGFGGSTTTESMVRGWFAGSGSHRNAPQAGSNEFRHSGAGGVAVSVVASTDASVRGTSLGEGSPAGAAVGVEGAVLGVLATATAAVVVVVVDADAFGELACLGSVEPQPLSVATPATTSTAIAVAPTLLPGNRRLFRLVIELLPVSYRTRRSGPIRLMMRYVIGAF